MGIIINCEDNCSGLKDDNSPTPELIIIRNRI